MLGYYKTTDPWLLRKHAEMLAEDRTPIDSKDNYVNATMVVKEDGKKVSENKWAY